MKKLVILAAGIIALAACDGSHSKRELQIQNDSLQIVLAERNAELDDIMGTFNEIQESFRQISDAENKWQALYKIKSQAKLEFQYSMVCQESFKEMLTLQHQYNKYLTLLNN